MVTVNVQFPESLAVIRRFAALPAIGNFVEENGQLFRVDAVVFRKSSATWSEARPTLYLAVVSADLTAELRESWNPPAKSKRKESER